MRFCSRFSYLSSSQEYGDIYKNGYKIYANYFIIFYKENNKGYSRMGITVSKKVGNAVVRNYFKRCLREVFRLNYSCFCESCDWVVTVKRDAGSLKYRDISSDILCAVSKIKKC